MTDARNAAIKYRGLGLSVIAVAPNGSKGPAKEVGAWGTLMREPATQDSIAGWYPEGTRNGVAIVGGNVSGELAILDFETGDAYTMFRVACADEGLIFALDECPIVITPNGGRHVYCFGVSEKCTKLARTEVGKTLIEIKGQGGYVLAPGCTSECHPTGLLYQWEQKSLLEADKIPTPIDKESWGYFVAFCRLQDCSAQVEPTPKNAGIDLRSLDVKRPGDEFNARGNWEEILTPHGWTMTRRLGAKIFWKRPGKDTEGISATTGHCSTEGSGDLLYIFSCNAHPFTEAKSYSKFGAYAMLNCSGDFKTASKSLAEKGFGDPTITATLINSNFAQAILAPVDSWKKNCPEIEPGRIFKWFGELKVENPDQQWHWHGYVYPGCKTLINALWKIGKTTLMAKLLQAFENGGSFCGQAVAKTRVLYVTEESDATWKPRGERFGYQEKNHGFCMKPFHGGVSMAQWGDFIGACAENMEKYGLQVLIVDTLANLWPVIDENNSVDVINAIRHFNKITQSGDRSKSVIAVHHSRKSGGENFTAARGSGALSADFDILLDFKKPEGGYGEKSKTKRLITASGRFNEITPAELLIDFIDDEYVALGDPADVHRDERRKIVIDVLDEHEWKTVDHIRIECNQRKQTVTDELIRLFGMGVIEQSGTGGKGSPRKFRKKSSPGLTQTNIDLGDSYVDESY